MSATEQPIATVFTSKPLIHGKYLWKEKQTQDYWREVFVDGCGGGSGLRCEISLGLGVDVRGFPKTIIMSDLALSFEPNSRWFGYWIRIS